MDWTELNALGPRFTEHLVKHYKEPRIFFHAFENEEDAYSLVREVFGSEGGADLAAEGVRRLMSWRDSMQSHSKREQTRRCNLSFEFIRHPGEQFGRSLQEEFEDIVRENPAYILDIAKRRWKRKRETSGTQRADVEREQRNVYALQLAEILKEACLPIVFQVEMLQDPGKAWIRIFGSRRSKTLWNRLRSWNKFRDWLLALSGTVWPKTLTPLIAYVEEKIQDGCSFSCVSEFHASFTILEQLGKVPEDKRLSNDPVWLGHVASWKLELELESRPPRSAKPYATAMLLSLEIFVLDLEQELYFRFIAWVAVFVRRDVTLSGYDWLGTGLELTSHESFQYKRDYLVPAPNAAFDGFVPKIVEPPSLSNSIRIVLGRLGTPRFQDGHWRANMSMLLAPGDVLLFWTGHSPRHFLNQAALALNISKERRDFLGRWSIGKSGSNAYIHTARQVVEEVQHQVASSLVNGTACIDESELLDELSKFSDEHNTVGHRIRRRHAQQLHRDLQQGPFDEGESGAEEPDVDLPVASEDHFQALQPQGSQAKYFVTVSRRTGVRRLHAYFKCPVRTQRCLETYDVERVDEETFDAMCAICKRRLKVDQGGADSDSSSTSGDSSSTEVGEEADNAND
ncbi:unnamed protein product [Cladocopium goreaui]|uniref:Latent membrane protein 1 n=1 Tax=Cladocopium goreaui TaxID=2562237 RepID=A0A9P1C998_9DINO|nr:unnamed protein product [Cladocopium goreaui]